MDKEIVIRYLVNLGADEETILKILSSNASRNSIEKFINEQELQAAYTSKIVETQKETLRGYSLLKAFTDNRKDLLSHK